MKRLIVSLAVVFGMVAVCCHRVEAPTVGEEMQKTVLELLPEGTIDSTLRFLKQGGLVNFDYQNSRETHTDYADYVALTSRDTAGESMQVVVAWNTSTQKVYDISYYWHMDSTRANVQDTFDTMERELQARYGAPTRQRMKADDGNGTYYLTTEWVGSANQGYDVCLQMACRREDSQSLLMLEVTNPANEY